ncbi:32043_t:CDS:2, partial [Racocetra persica]
KHYLDPHCVYLNYISTGRTWRSKVTGYYWPRLLWRNFSTWFISVMLGRYKLSTEAEQQVLRTSSSSFWQNDGTLSVHAQRPPPHQQVLMNIALDQKLYDPIDHELTPGVWYNVYVNDPSQTVLFNEYDKGLGYSDPSSKSYLTSTTSERIGKYSSDKAGLEWIHKIETIEILNSPSKMLYWMNQMQSGLDNGSPLSESGNKKEFSGNPLSATSFMPGPMFIKAKRRLTADDYRAS